MIAPSRRPHDAQASRQALVDAAGALFEDRGFDAATVRDIGERAGVDAALIARYFGSKEGLYLATLEQEGAAPIPTDPGQILEYMLSRHDQQGSAPIGIAMVSPTLTDACREQVRDIVARRVVQPLSAQLAQRGVADAELRAEVIVALAAGLSLTRAGGTLPALSAAPLAEVLAMLQPLVDALQAGPAPSSSAT